MTGFHYVPIQGGRSWEWEHGGLTYQAVSLNGSNLVFVYTNKIDDPEDWAYQFSRPTNGKSAQGVAERICEEVIAGESESS